LLSNKTVYENVAFAMEAAGRLSKEIEENVPFVLDLVGLTDKAQDFRTSFPAESAKKRLLPER